MNFRKVKDLYVKVEDKNGVEGKISLSELGIALVETVGEAANLTCKELSKEMKNLSSKSKVKK